MSQGLGSYCKHTFVDGVCWNCRGVCDHQKARYGREIFAKPIGLLMDNKCFTCGVDKFTRKGSRCEK